MAHEATTDAILQEAKEIYHTQNRLDEATNLHVFFVYVANSHKSV